MGVMDEKKNAKKEMMVLRLDALTKLRWNDGILLGLQRIWRNLDETD